MKLNKIMISVCLIIAMIISSLQFPFQRIYASGKNNETEKITDETDSVETESEQGKESSNVIDSGEGQGREEEEVDSTAKEETETEIRSISEEEASTETELESISEIQETAEDKTEEISGEETTEEDKTETKKESKKRVIEHTKDSVEEFICDGDYEIDKSLVDNLKRIDQQLNGDENYQERTGQNEVLGTGLCPSEGNVHSLVLMVDFDDITFAEDFTKEYVEQMMFGEPNAASEKYPKESLNAWYQRSSYGKLSFYGEVVEITLEHTKEYYTYDADTNPDGRKNFWAEIWDNMEQMHLDWSDYDLNGDYYLDSSCVIAAGEAGEWASQWWSQVLWAGDESTFDETYNMGRVALCIESHMNGVSTVIHEFGHCLGLMDLYDTSYSTGDNGGINTTDMMNNDTGDFNALCKMLLGWIDANQIQLIEYGADLQTISLDSYTKTGSCALLLLDDGNTSIFSEYFLVQYMDFYGNDKELQWKIKKEQLRIYHINAYLNESGNSFEYNNNGNTNSKLIEAVDQDAEYVHGKMSNTLMDPGASVWGATLENEYGCGYLEGDEFTPYSAPSTAKYPENNLMDTPNQYSGLYLRNIIINGQNASFDTYYEETVSEDQELVIVPMNDLNGCSANNLKFQVIANSDIWLAKDSEIRGGIRKKGENKAIGDVSIRKYLGGNYSFEIDVDDITLESAIEYEVFLPEGMFITSYGAASKEIIISGIITETNFWNTREILVPLDSQKYVQVLKNEYVLNIRNNFEIVAMRANGDIYICEIDRETGGLLSESLVVKKDGAIETLPKIRSFGQAGHKNYWILVDDVNSSNCSNIYIINSDKELKYTTILNSHNDVRYSGTTLLNNNKLAITYYTLPRYVGYIIDLETFDLHSISDPTILYIMGEYLLEKRLDKYCIKDYEDHILTDLDLDGLNIINVVDTDNGYSIYGNQNDNIVVYQLDSDFYVKNKVIIFKNSEIRNVYQLDTGFLIYWCNDISNDYREYQYSLLDMDNNYFTNTSLKYTYCNNISLNGNEYLVVTNNEGKENEFCYQISEQIDIPKSGDNILDKIIISKDIQLNSDGYVIYDNNKSLFEFVESIKPVNDEIYSIVKINNQQYIKVSGKDNIAEKYCKILMQEVNNEKYTVIFDLQGHGAEFEEYLKYTEISKGNTIKCPRPPEAVNYKFTGWYKDAQCTLLWNFATDTVEENITLYAGWEEEISETEPTTETETASETESQTQPETEPVTETTTEPNTIPESAKKVYTVRFELQGHGTVLDEYSKYVEIPEGSTINAPTAPKAEGYQFTGWYKDEQCFIIWDFETDTIQGNTVLYAGWKPEKEPANPEEPDIPSENIPDGLWISDINDHVYTGQPIIPSVTVYYNKTRLVAGRDYTIRYQNNTKASASISAKPPTVIVKGKGNYSGTRRTFFTIKKVQLDKDENLRAAQIYSAGIKYTPVVITEGSILKAGTDYTLTYLDAVGKVLKKQPVKAGNYQMRVVGKGSCEGEISFEYMVAESDGANSIAHGNATVRSMIYGSKEPDVTLTVDGNILVRDVDYMVSFVNTGKKGTATATLIGIGSYTGTLKKNFKVQPAVIQDKEIHVEEIVAYEKGGVKADVTVLIDDMKPVQGIDYTVSYKNNKKIGTASVTIKGKGNYTGAVTKYFKVEPQSLAAEGMQIFVTDVLSGKKPAITIYDANGKKLSANSDYKATVDKLAHQVTITGGKNGLYNARAPITIPYQELQKGKLITSATLNKKAGIVPENFVYTGKKIELEKNWLIVKAGKTVLKSDEFEILGYVNNTEKGTATVIIRGCKTYGGIKMMNFKIKTKGML